MKSYFFCSNDVKSCLLLLPSHLRLAFFILIFKEVKKRNLEKLKSTITGFCKTIKQGVNLSYLRNTSEIQIVF